jgi:hypothetical protein
MCGITYILQEPVGMIKVGERIFLRDGCIKVIAAIVERIVF